MFLIARKHRISFFAFCLVVGVFFSSVFGNVKATGVEVVITSELTEQLLLKLAGKMASEYVEDVVKDKIQNDLGIDPAPVVSSSSFVKWSKPERVKEYIENYGSQRLAETWAELNSQFLKTNGTVDNEYYIAFYRCLINDVVGVTNDVLDEINNNYVNSKYHFNNLSDSLKQACLAYPIYIIAQYRNSDGSLSGKPVMFFMNDIYFGIKNSYQRVGDMYIYRRYFGDIVGRSNNSNEYYNIFGTDIIYFCNDTISTEKIDFSSYSQNKEYVKCTTYNLYSQELVDYGVGEGYDFLNVGLTPKGKSMFKKGVSDEHLNSTLSACDVSRTQLPIYLQKPDTDGKNVEDYVGNDNTIILRLDVDNDGVYPNFVLDDDSTTIQTEEDVDNLDVSPVSKEKEAEKKWGWLSFLFDWFQKIIDAILSLVNGIVDGILDGLKGLFVPSGDFFTSNFSSIKDKFAEKFGFSDYELFFDALKNCAKGAWNFEFTFHVAEKEYTLAIANVDEWFKETNLSKIHFLMRGFFYPLMILANVNYMTWFLRGSYLISPTKSSDG